MDDVKTMPCEGLKTEKMPGHWVLARHGKRVLRPGGIELTRRMLDAVAISQSDDVVEFAPGLGVTARMTLALTPASYTAVERDPDAAAIVSRYVDGKRARCVIGSASATGLPSASASVVYGEAMLTMQGEQVKREIIAEAARLLRPGGRYAIHEMCLSHESLAPEERKQVERELTGVVHHGVRPLTISEWKQLLESEGFEVQAVMTAPMSLLEPGRLIRDEGIFRAIRFVAGVLTDAAARRRVFGMRKVFRRHRGRIAGVSLIAVKRGVATMSA